MEFRGKAFRKDLQARIVRVVWHSKGDIGKDQEPLCMLCEAATASAPEGGFIDRCVWIEIQNLKMDVALTPKVRPRLYEAIVTGEQIVRNGISRLTLATTGFVQ